MTTAPRVEHDSMGALDVPTTALWGAQTQRAIQNFPPSGLRMPRAFVRALGLIKYAAAGANWELGDLGEPLALAVQAAALAFRSRFRIIAQAGGAAYGCCARTSCARKWTAAFRSGHSP